MKKYIIIKITKRARLSVSHESNEVNAALDLLEQSNRKKQQESLRKSKECHCHSRKNIRLCGYIHTRADMHVYVLPANATRVQVRSSTLHTRQLMVRIAQVIPPHDRLSQLHLLDTHYLRGTRVNLS